MRKYLGGFLVGVVMVLGVVSCTPSATADDPNHGNNNPGMYRNTWHKMPDGRTVYCMFYEKYDTGYAAGPVAFECDFDHAFVAKK